MKKNNNIGRIWKLILWATGMIILLIFAIIWYWVVAFDTNEEVTDSKEVSSNVFFEEFRNGDKQDSWETVIQNSQDPEDTNAYRGTTFSSRIVNNNSYNIKNWVLRIDISQECFLDAFWCGSFEIHQFRKGNELVNTIKNQSEDISGLSIDRNIYSDNMMICLLPGDYLIYYPSVENMEDTVRAREEVGIGFIFYHREVMDLSNWSMTYTNDLKMSDLLVFKLLLVLIGMWTVAFIMYLCYEALSDKMEKQINNRIRNISIMTDLYLEAYIIDIADNSAYLIKGDEKKLIFNLVGNNVREKIDEIIKSSCQEFYCDDLSEFLNLNTVSERMEGVSSISFEYIDANIGWCAVRLFKDSDEDEIKRVVLTIQDINEEKRKLKIIEERMNLAEYKHSVSGSFLETVSFALNDISKKISTDGKAILEGSSDENVKTVADRIVMNTRHMNLIQNTMIDLYEIECKRMALNINEYNLYDMVGELKHILSPFAEGKDYDFIVDVDENIPKALLGDSDRLEQILVIILFSSMIMTQSGFVKFSVFGKQHGDEEELIFSVRDSAQGFTEEQLKEIYGLINGESIETFDNASLVYLKIINGILTYMNSELKIISVLNEGSDFYFTIRQKIVE